MENILINPYNGAEISSLKFLFGMSSEELIKVDKKVFYTLRHENWQLERRGGYSTELIDGKLCAVVFRLDPNWNNIQVAAKNDVDLSNLENIEKLKISYEHYIYADEKSVLFPKLGVVYLVTPFKEGWEAPRAGVFNTDIIAFAKNRLFHYQKASCVLTLNPRMGVTIAGGEEVSFGMLRCQTEGVWEESEFVWDEAHGAHEHIKEYRFEKGAVSLQRERP